MCKKKNVHVFTCMYKPKGVKNENSKNYINQWRNTDFRQGQYLRKFLNEMNFNQRQELYKKQTYGGAI